MNKFSHISIIVIAAILLSITACKKDKAEDTPLPVGTIKLFPTTIVVDQNTDAQLIEVNEDNIIFQGNTSQIEEIKTGSVIVSGISTHAPQGYLRKVLSVTKSGSTTILSTDPATLEDAIEECNIKLQKEFNIEDTATYKTDFNPFASDINYLLHDEDGNLQTTLDQTRIKGNLSIKPQLLFDLKIHKLKRLQLAQIGVTFTEEVDLRVQAASIGGQLLQDEFNLLNFKLGTYTFNAGFFPITVTPTFKVKLGANASISGTAQVGITVKGAQTGYVIYTPEKGWQAEKLMDYNPISPYQSLTGSLNGEIYLKPELKFAFYDFDLIKKVASASTSIYGKIYFSASGNCNITPSGFNDCGWLIKAGTQVGGTANLKVARWSIIDYDGTILDWEKIIYQTQKANAPNGTTDSRISFNLSNGDYAFTDINNCTLSSGGDNGSSNSVYFDVDASVFNPNQYFEVKVVSTFEGGFVKPLYFSSSDYSVKIIDYNTIRINFCTRFANTNFVDKEITLLNSYYKSKPITVRLFKPYGANKKESNDPPSVSLN